MSEISVCVPVAGATRKEILAHAVRAVKEQPDLLEWRADFFSEIVDPAQAAETLAALRETAAGLPILFTLRTKPEGGAADPSPEAYREILTWAADAAVDLVDLEGLREKRGVPELVARFQRAKIPVIASAHCFDRMPSESEMKEILTRLEATGADRLKLAVMPETEEDVETLLRVAAAYRAEGRRPLIAIAMGELGAVSRCTMAAGDPVMTYAAVGHPTAPGQLSVEETRRRLAAESRAE